MAKIAINLLPIEFRVEELKNAKFYKVQIIGVVTILLVIFLSSLTIALRVLQSQNILKLQNNVAASEQKISDFKDTQVSLLLLKDRLITINQYLGNSSSQVQMYKLVASLLPATVSISAISIDQSGQISILATAPDVNSLENLIVSLTSKETNEDKIKQVSLESINRGKDGLYRLSLRIKPNS